jgi:phosphoribosylformimino-5-aminoimidazole carboxamide ribotide isomerase
MEVLPSIDLREGKVVRLIRGDYGREKTYSADPSSVARAFEQAGASWIHVVDLDAARNGTPTNTACVEAIRQAVRAKIELGGGARSEQAIARYFSAGADRVVVGSAALKDWAWFREVARRPDWAGKIVLGLDSRGGRLAAHGWTDQTDLDAVEVAARVRGWPLAAIVHTDIDRDAMLQGVNVEGTAAMIAATDVPVIASGGVASLQDVRRCKEIGCAGVIVGRAYYEGRLDLAEAVRLARETAAGQGGGRGATSSGGGG